MPKVSVIIPCYKQAHYLPVTLASVQAQTLEDWECLIINDGSPDDTESVAMSWVEKDERFRYYRKENGGLSSARNFGIELAYGRFMQFLDSDDVILPKKLEIQSKELESSHFLSLSFCDYTRGSAEDIYESLSASVYYLPPVLSDKTTIYELAGDWETRLSIPPHCFLFSRHFFDEGIRFDEELPNHEDWDCWMRIFLKAKEIKYCDEKLAIYRYHKNSMCNNMQAMRDGYIKASAFW
jgi:hypothetical protein